MKPQIFPLIISCGLRQVDCQFMLNFKIKKYFHWMSIKYNYVVT